MIKKSNIISTNLSKEAIYILQQLGYLDGNKKSSKDKSTSKFISERICDYIDLDPRLNRNQMKLRILKKELVAAQKQRDKIEDTIILIANEISNIKKLLNEAKK